MGAADRRIARDEGGSTAQTASAQGARGTLGIRAHRLVSRGFFFGNSVPRARGVAAVSGRMADHLCRQRWAVRSEENFELPASGLRRRHFLFAVFVALATHRLQPVLFSRRSHHRRHVGGGGGLAVGGFRFLRVHRSAFQEPP